MPTRPSLPEDEWLERCRVAVANALSAPPPLAARLAERGYDTPELQKGRTLLDDAVTANAEQTTAGASGQSATDDKQGALKNAVGAYQDITDTVRAAFPGDAARHAQFGIAGELKRTPADVLQRAAVFFGAITTLADLVPDLERFGLKPARRAQLKTVFDTLAALQAGQTRAKGTARTSTTHQNDAYKALDAWMTPFERMAKRACADHPGDLTLMGLDVPLRSKKRGKDASNSETPTPA